MKKIFILIVFSIGVCQLFAQCPSCTDCEIPTTLDFLSDMSFSGGGGQDDGISMTLPISTTAGFAGHEWALDQAVVSGLAFGDICIFADFEVTADFDLSAFPVTVEFRIENKGATGFPDPWTDFNTSITANGSYSFGGNLSSATGTSANGAFDPAGVSPNLVVAIANFGSALPGNVTVTYNNLYVTDASAICGAAFNIVPNSDATICAGTLGTEISDWQTMVEAAQPVANPNYIVYSSVPDGDATFPNTTLADGNEGPACGPVGRPNFAYAFCDVTNTYDLISQFTLISYPEPVSFAPTGTVDCSTNPEVTSACAPADILIEYSMDGGSTYSTTNPTLNSGDPDQVVNWRVSFVAAEAASCTPASGTYTITCGGALATCPSCAACEMPDPAQTYTLDDSVWADGGSFMGNFGAGATGADDGTAITFPTGSNNTFAGHQWQVTDIPAAANLMDICVSADFEITADFDLSAYPFTLEFRLENNMAPGPSTGNWTSFNSSPITSTGSVTLGGNLSTGTSNGSGFDPAGPTGNLVIAVAIVNGPLPGNLTISYSNFYVAESTATCVPAPDDFAGVTAQDGECAAPPQITLPAGYTCTYAYLTSMGIDLSSCGNSTPQSGTVTAPYCDTFTPGNNAGVVTFTVTGPCGTTMDFDVDYTCFICDADNGTLMNSTP